MSIRIKGINIFKQGLDNEYRILVLEKMIHRIITSNPELFSQTDYNEAQISAAKELKVKYPEAGIELKEVKNEE